MDVFLAKWLTKEKGEQQPKLGCILLHDATVYQMMALGIEPLVIRGSKMGQRPKRIDSHTTIVVKGQLV